MSDWISVEERLPDYGYSVQPVIVYTTSQKVCSAEYWRSRQQFLGYHGDTQGIRVTYWMPLPPPPEVKDEE